MRAFLLGVLLVGMAQAQDPAIRSGPVSFDFLFWGNLVWREAVRAGWSDQSFDMYSRGSVIEAEAALSPDVTLFSTDLSQIGSTIVQDLYLDWRLARVLSLRAGLMLPPMGLKASLEPAEGLLDRVLSSQALLEALRPA